MKGDNAKCGRPDVDDGYCLDIALLGGFLCTVPCISDFDCPRVVRGDFQPECESLTHGSDMKMDSLCTL